MGIVATAQQKKEAIIRSKEASERYREAIRVINELRVFDLLREQILYPITDNNEANYCRISGYIQCMNDLNTFLDMPTKYSELPLDFGAREQLKSEGFNDEEIIKMLGE